MDLDVTVGGIRVKPLLSVNIQYGDVIYSQNLFTEMKFDGKLFNVLDNAGVIISKINSCHNKKRPRDIYDIYLSLLEEGALGKINHLAQINPSLNENLKNYSEKLKSDWPTYSGHLKEFGVNDPEQAKKLLLLGR
jgi:hypothetical protein